LRISRFAQRQGSKFDCTGEFGGVKADRWPSGQLAEECKWVKWVSSTGIAFHPPTDSEFKR